MKYCKGISLLETLLILVIIAVILVASMNRYQQYQFEAKFNQVDKSVTVLQQALAEYFFSYCHNPQGKLPLEPESAQKFIEQFKPDNKLNIENPLGQEFQVAVKPIKDDETGAEIYQLFVIAVLDKVANVQDYVKILHASGCVDAAGQPQVSCADKRLAWQQLPWYETAGVESNLWILKGGLGQFYKQQVGESAAGDLCFSKPIK